MEAARTPAPARDTGLPPGVRVGPLGRRLLAYVVDSLLPAAAAVTIGATSGSGSHALIVVVAVLVAVAWTLVCWQQLVVRAASPGMRLLGLQLVGFLDGRPLGWGRVVLRWLVFTLLGLTVVGALLLLVSLLVNPRHQGWHDRAVGGVVIVQRPLAPRHPKATTTRSSAPARTGRTEATAPIAQPTPTALRPAAVPVSPPVAGDPALPPEPAVVDAPPAPAATPPAAPLGEGHRSHRRIVDGWVAELDDGREIAVHGLVLIGRNPQPGEGEDDAALVKVSDDSRTVSKTHLAIGVDDAGLFVVDRGSTNGSTITPPDEPTTPAGAFQAVPAGEGSVVSFGDHWLRIHRRRD